MRAQKGEIDELGLEVLVVTFESRELATLYVDETELPWPLLVDDARTLYGAFAMSRGDWWRIWGPASWGAYLRLLRRGRRLRAATGDIYQLGGDVLIDPRGRVELHRVGEGPADRPAVADLLQSVRRGANR